MGQVAQNALDDLQSYINEYGRALGFRVGFADNPMVRDYVEANWHLICDHDVVLFGKSGCGFCTRAKRQLQEQLDLRTAGTSFTLHLSEVKSSTTTEGRAFKEALSQSLQVIFPLASAAFSVCRLLHTLRSQHNR
jgi:glutaredoxin